MAGAQSIPSFRATLFRPKTEMSTNETLARLYHTTHQTARLYQSDYNMTQTNKHKKKFMMGAIAIQIIGLETI